MFTHGLFWEPGLNANEVGAFGGENPTFYKVFTVKLSSLLIPLGGFQDLIVEAWTIDNDVANTAVAGQVGPDSR